MILVAQCRLGLPCRYHGKTVESPALIKKLRGLNYKTICPECEAGLPVPRPPIRVQSEKYLIGDKDITDRLKMFCFKRCQNLDPFITIFIGVKGSPCCDPKWGLWAQTLKKIGIPTRLSL